MPAALLGGVAVAAQLPQERAVGWDRARAEIAKYRATLDNSGLVEVDARISPRVDAEDLQALCRARTEAVTAARRRGESLLAALPPGDDPITNEKRAAAYRLLGAVASAAGRHGHGAHATSRPPATRSRPTPPTIRTSAKRWSLLDEAVGIAAMRQGEIDNCLVMTKLGPLPVPAARGRPPPRPGGRQGRLRRVRRRWPIASRPTSRCAGC